jgi:hypothetical protein
LTLLNHDLFFLENIVLVPSMFGPEESWDIYYKLLEELKDRQWVSWHADSHLIVKSPDSSPTLLGLVGKICTYFNIHKDSIGYRFNWYNNNMDWKPFHHDSAAINPERAKQQNITVVASFGTCRELAFMLTSGPSTRVYFPQPNNGISTFGRDVNIRWKHGLPVGLLEDEDGRGRISIIVWGLARDVIEEEGSPALVPSERKKALRLDDH